MTGLEYVMFTKEITTTKLADKFDVSAQLVNHWIKGRRKPSEEAILYIEELTGVSSEYLLKKEITRLDKVQIECILLEKEDVDTVHSIEVSVIKEHEELKQKYKSLQGLYNREKEDKEKKKAQLLAVIENL